MTTQLSTPAIIAQAHALADALGSSDPFSPAGSAGGKACALLVDGALYRDLDAAMQTAGVAAAREAGVLPADQIYPARYSLQKVSFGDKSRLAPKRHTYQASWRDHTGYVCKTERMAKWVAQWIALHLEPRDADGNPCPNNVRKIKHEGEDHWLAVTASWKVPD